MDKRTNQIISKYIAKVAHQNANLVRAYLFGSYVRGEADSLSDIDILVDLDYSQRIGLQFIQMKIDLEKLLNSKVDLVSSKGLSKYIKPHVDNEKLLIYAR